MTDASEIPGDERAARAAAGRGRTSLNPLRSEAAAFRLLLYVVAAAAAIIAAVLLVRALV